MADFTKRAIKETFMRLLEEHPLSQITVKTLAEACGINRNTFYYHFADIPALIEEITIEEAERTIAEYPSIESLEACLAAAVGFAKKRRRAILHIVDSVNRAAFEKSLWRVSRHVVGRYIGAVSRDLPGNWAASEDGRLITDFYADVCFGIVMQWIDEGMPDGMETKIARLYELKQGSVEEMLKRSLNR